MLLQRIQTTVHSFAGRVPTTQRTLPKRPRNLEEMIAAGEYDWIDPRYDALAKGRWRVPVQSRLFALSKPCLLEIRERIGDECLDAELDACAVRLATLEQILAFGALFPEEQRKASISTRVLPHGRRKPIRPSLRCVDGERGLYEMSLMDEVYYPGERLLVFPR